MTRNFYLLTLCFFCAILISCSSPIGGTLTGYDKEPVANALVKLIVIDNSGEKLEDVVYTATDGSGNFSFFGSDDVGASFIVEAILSNGTLKAFACGNGSKVNLNPVTDAVVNAIIYLTEGGQGRVLEDFSKKELREIIKKVETDKDIWKLDFKDSQALTNKAINLAGMLIPDAAGGNLSASPLVDVSYTPTITDASPIFITALPGHPCGKDNYWIESSLFGFDLLKDGTLCKGASHTLGLFSPYGVAYRLNIDGDTFLDPVSHIDTTSGAFPGDSEIPAVNPPDIHVEDYRQVVFGPVLTVKGLSVTRKVYIPETGDFARYAEIISNPTDGDLTINVKVSGGIGIGEFVVYGTGIETLVEQSGNLIIDSADNWAASIDATTELFKPHPAVGFVWDGVSGKDQVDLVSFPPANDSQDFNYWWQNVTIPAQSTNIYLSYSYLSGYKVASVMETLLNNAYMYPDESLMTTDELNAIQNFSVTRGNVIGEAGSVPSFSDLEIINENSSASTTLEARRDGGFSSNLDAQSGEKIKVKVSIDGELLKEKSLVVP